MLYHLIDHDLSRGISKSKHKFDNHFNGFNK